MAGVAQIGPVIAAYYASAGALLFASAHGAILASSNAYVRSNWCYVAASLGMVLYQILCALQYGSVEVDAAVSFQKGVNFTIALVLPLFLAALVYLSPTRRLIPLILVSVGLSLVLAAGNVLMPNGVRFADLHNTRLAVFPWGERMWILGGTPTLIGKVMTFSVLMIVVVGIVQTRSIVKSGRSMPGGLIGIATALMLFTNVLAVLTDLGVLSLPYLGGFGYLVYVFCLGLQVQRQIAEEQAARQRAFERLTVEIDHHGQTHARLRDLIDHDAVTSLPNRAGLFGHLKGALEESRYNGRQLLLMLIDIDGFDEINDMIGHEAGDELLVEIARRLKEHVGESGFVARVGGDEFVVAATELGMASSIGLLFQTQAKMASLSFDLRGQSVGITLGIGIATYPEDGGAVSDLLAAADLAMREAKRRGRGQMCFFRRDLSEEIRRRAWLSGALKAALDKRQFELFFQPQVDAVDGRPVCMEALIRWFHPTEGLIPPDHFIPLAEEMQLIIDIGDWVIDEACRRLAQWRKRGVGDVRVAVNLSAQQLRQIDLPGTVGRALARHCLGGGDFELEITESVLMSDPQKAIVQLQKLRDLGVRLSIDDFGTGYSSLSYLNRLPVDGLKLDRSFVSEIGTEGKGGAICASAIKLATTLGIETVAEGVEHEAQADFLREQGCQLLQGYLFSEPLPPDKAADFLVRAAALSGGEGLVSG